jgi:GNAT superfamily N-acetyltransferase
LPGEFPKTEIALMTREEFLLFRNPQDKHHPSDAYDYTLESLNSTLHSVGIAPDPETLYRDSVTVKKGDQGYVFVREDGEVFAVLYQGTLYYQSKYKESSIQTAYYRGHERVQLPVERKKPVKYLTEYVAWVSNLAGKNLASYPHLIQRLVVSGEPVEVRAESAPEKDKGITLVILNPLGQVIARASDEWGATLFSVAREYRGKGLGRVIGSYWYQYNPSYESGGFTPKGEQNALSLWEDRVREFLSLGWYGELVRAKRLTKERVEQILSGLRRGRPTRNFLEVIRTPAKPVRKSITDLLVYSQDSTFVLYDPKFLENQEEDYIHGYGFFRDAPNIGVFLYRIDYDLPYKDMANAVALQMARDEGDPLYVGEGYGDLLELEGPLESVLHREGAFVSLTRDILPLKSMARLEQRARKKADQYDQIHHSLLEMAEAKWS